MFDDFSGEVSFWENNTPKGIEQPLKNLLL